MVWVKEALSKLSLWFFENEKYTINHSTGLMKFPLLVAQLHNKEKVADGGVTSVAD